MPEQDPSRRAVVTGLGAAVTYAALVIGGKRLRLHLHPVTFAFWTYLIATLVLTPGERATEPELKEFCHARLAPYEIPADIRLVDVLPRTDSGKVDLLGVRAVFEPAVSPDTDYADPPAARAGA